MITHEVLASLLKEWHNKRVEKHQCVGYLEGQGCCIDEPALVEFLHLNLGRVTQ